MTVASIDLAIIPDNVGLCLIENKRVRFPALHPDVVEVMRG